MQALTLAEERVAHRAAVVSRRNRTMQRSAEPIVTCDAKLAAPGQPTIGQQAGVQVSPGSREESEAERADRQWEETWA